MNILRVVTFQFQAILVIFGTYMNLTGFQVVRKRKPVSVFYYFLASIFINETLYLILTEVQSLIHDNAVSFIIRKIICRHREGVRGVASVASATPFFQVKLGPKKTVGFTNFKFLPPSLCRQYHGTTVVLQWHYRG